LALVGIPSETIAYDGKTLITGRVVIMPVKLTDEPETAGRKRENQFYARLQDAGNVEDIDGMSGGPIFAFKKIEGNWKYSVVGVQSGWYQQIETIAACPFISLGTALEAIVKSVVEQAAE